MSTGTTRIWPDTTADTHPEVGEAASLPAIQAITGPLPLTVPTDDAEMADALARCMWLARQDKESLFRADPKFQAEFLRLAMLVRVWLAAEREHASC